LSAHRARFTYFYVALALHDHYRSQYQTKSDGLLGVLFLRSSTSVCDVRGWFGMFAPARVPADIIAKLYAETKRAMQAPEVLRRITLDGAEVVVNSPQEFSAEVRAEYAKWRDLVKRPGMKF